MKRSLEIIVASVLVTVLYSIIHNQITVRISPEFFTTILPRHPWANGDNLTLLALAWGITSTWWVGLIGGFVLTFFARVEDEPRITLSQLRFPALVAIIVTIGLESFLGRIWSGWYGAYGLGYLDNSVSNLPQPVLDNLWLVSGLHDMAYLAGGLAFVGLAIWVLVTRFRMRRSKKKK